MVCLVVCAVCLPLRTHRNVILSIAHKREEKKNMDNNRRLISAVWFVLQLFPIMWIMAKKQCKAYKDFNQPRRKLRKLKALKVSWVVFCLVE